MLPVIALFLALFAAQAPAPPGPPPTEPPTAPTSAQTAPAKPPCRNPDADGRYRIGCGVSAPQLTQRVEEKFPAGATAKNLRGGVTVSLMVDAEGNPADVHISHSMIDQVDKSSRAFQQQLEDNMVDAVKQYRFKPAMFQGKPVPVELNVELNFTAF
ncbi:MAG: energy transducer TonB [Acidobacteriaceae bacterium]|jgi:protein TonB